MRKIYEVSYSKNNNKCEIELNNEKQTLKDMIDWLAKDNSFILISESILFSADEGKISVFYLGENAEKLLVFKLNSSSEIEETELGRLHLKKEEINNISQLILNILKLIYNLLTVNENKKKYKKIKGTYCDKIKIKNSSIEIKCYPELNGAFKIDKKDDKFKILINNEKKREIVIPSSLHPLPHHNNVKLFTSENTFELEDIIINDLLSHKVFKPGFCYTNIEEVVNTLSNSEDFKHSIDYYVGWTIIGTRLVHHAWAIIDDKHIIDTSRFIKEREMVELSKEAEKGCLPLNRDGLVNKLIKYYKEEIPFNKKYVCGKALEGSIYIGVKSSSNVGREEFNQLILKQPNHPDYLNINKQDGSNRTLNEFYSKVK